MKKYLFGTSLVILATILAACGGNESATSTSQSTSTKGTVVESSKDTSVEEKSDETIKKYEMTKDEKTSFVELTIKGDGLLKEKVTIEGPFSLVDAETVEEAQAAVDEMEEEQDSTEGVTVRFSVNNDSVRLITETDYQKVDIDSLGITEDMLTSDGKLPLAEVRIQDYEAMGYEEVE
ncbi:DUF1307 domain-containing protein [Enterococcus termitis]|uniref:DUF1307 domain-containing protein n=1 Tax=Enterococcus termitis TaxID=332950 RepID=A0A1E5G9D3_9ENTE|nr:DUF1307 domain-containing protein [Enterococcus termitis]OEG09195.1 hypothetical protein BCR25_11545 [Enterococcus termitis]OJG98656.1 hypothetical protein RV18_GL003079 [Enterococcus termitis]